MNRHSALLLSLLGLAGCASPLGTFAPEEAPPATTLRPELSSVLGATSELDDTNPDPRVVEVSLTARLETLTLGDGMTYEMMTYNGSMPGPLLQAAVGDEVIVHFTNELDEPTTIHWHGLRIPDDMDGSPRIQEPVAPGETFTYHFVVPDAGTFWYHPHVRSNVQVERGLYGPIVIRDAWDASYDAERVLVLDDILVDPDSELLPPPLSSTPEVMHGRYGNVLLTNGHDITELGAEPGTQGQVERWRIVNTANARTMELSIRGARWRVIGTDGGLLREPYEVERLILPVGQRYDLEVSYEDAGTVELLSHVYTTTAAGTLTQIALPAYTVDVPETGATLEPVTSYLRPERAPRESNRMETITFSATSDPVRGIVWRLNGLARPTEPLFTFRQGDTVRFVLENQSGPEHPFHLHGQWFEVVSAPGEIGPQPGLKDTLLIPGGATVEVVAYLDNPGMWMAHCHILEHAELGMMAEIRVEPAE